MTRLQPTVACCCMVGGIQRHLFRIVSTIMWDLFVKKALITGITGQDGVYLTELLLNKGYEVHGLRRRLSQVNKNGRIEQFCKNCKPDPLLYFHYGDLTDSSSVVRVMQKVKPDEVYNLAAQSHVAISYQKPEYTTDTNALGALRLLEAIKTLGLEKKTKFYQASSSEMFGMVRERPQKETTPFYPRSPYGVSKVYSYWITVNYREAYGLHASNGILFNHESPLRGENFVTKKITKAAARIKHGLQKTLSLGNLNAMRDWGYAGDYVKAQWLMLQQEKAGDYVIATGVQRSVRDFCDFAFQEIGVTLKWEGEGLNEKGVICQLNDVRLPLSIGDAIVQVSPEYYRPAEVNELCGDASKAKAVLGWRPETSFNELVSKMVAYDVAELGGSTAVI
jgi:GDPmannose 4,6-dehydratase